VIIVPKSALHMEKGTPAIFENVAESGVRRYRQFCATCGTPSLVMPLKSVPVAANVASVPSFGLVDRSSMREKKKPFRLSTCV
jgi:hypothetical protein